MQESRKPPEDSANIRTEFVWGTDESPASESYILPAVSDMLARVGAKRILDLGCGNGSMSAKLVHAGYEVTGLDASQSGIALARSKYPHVVFEHFAIGDALPDAHVEAFDVVLSTEVIEHLLLPRQLLTTGWAALKPDGIMIVSTPYHGYLKNLALALTGSFDKHWHPVRDYGHVKFFSIATLASLFQECGFTDLQCVRVGRIPILAKSMVMAGRVRK